jgi:hypothetical protein
VVAHLALAIPVVAVVMAAVARGEAHEEPAEEDGTDDEDAACDDADPCSHGVQPTVTVYGYDNGLVRSGDGRSLWCGGLEWPGCRFRRRCFAHDSIMRLPAQALVMNWL